MKIDMKYILTTLMAAGLVACGGDGQDAQAQSSPQSFGKLNWQDRNVRLKDSDFIGKKFSFVGHDTHGSNYDPYYQNGSYPDITELNFHKNGRVNKHYRNVATHGKAIPLQWEIEGNKVYINNGRRNLGTGIRAPLVIEFNKKPSDETVVKWTSGIRGNTTFFRIHKLERISASNQANSSYKLRRSDIAGKTITFSFSGGIDRNNVEYVFERGGTGNVSGGASGPITWEIQGNVLKVGHKYGAIRTYTFNRAPHVGDEISRTMKSKYANGTAQVYVFDIQ